MCVPATERKKPQQGTRSSSTRKKAELVTKTWNPARRLEEKKGKKKKRRRSGFFVITTEKRGQAARAERVSVIHGLT